MEKKLLYGTLFLFKFKIPKKKKKAQLRFQILTACRETGSLPEEVKQKDNLCEHNIQLQLRMSIDICGLFATFFS